MSRFPIVENKNVGEPKAQSTMEYVKKGYSLLCQLGIREMHWVLCDSRALQWTQIEICGYLLQP
jgi:hypothetical protein